MRQAEAEAALVLCGFRVRVLVGRERRGGGGVKRKRRKRPATGEGEEGRRETGERSGGVFKAQCLCEFCQFVSAERQERSQLHLFVSIFATTMVFLPLSI
jgi:hypothetical protein